VILQASLPPGEWFRSVEEWRAYLRGHAGTRSLSLEIDAYDRDGRSGERQASAMVPRSVILSPLLSSWPTSRL
jgi:hypothetical protein